MNAVSKYLRVQFPLSTPVSRWQNRHLGTIFIVAKWCSMGAGVSMAEYCKIIFSLSFNSIFSVMSAHALHLKEPTISIKGYLYLSLAPNHTFQRRTECSKDMLQNSQASLFQQVFSFINI